MQGYLRVLTPGSRERQALEYENATGRSAPASMMPAPPHEPTPHYQPVASYDDQGNPNGAYSFNTLTGTAVPLGMGGNNMRPPTKGHGDDPAFPNGVKDWLMAVRNETPDYQSAVRKVAGTMPQLRAQHPRIDPIKVDQGLRLIYGQPTNTGSGFSFTPGANVPPSGGAPQGRGGAAPKPKGPPAYQRGQTLQLRDGSTATVIGVNPDGSLQVQ
jgi:hypothetical protein